MRDQVKTESVRVHLLLRGRGGRMCDGDRGEQGGQGRFFWHIAPRHTRLRRSYSLILSSAVLRNSPEHLAFSHSRVAEPSINQTFTPDWYRNRSQSSALPNHVDDHPVVLPRLQLIQSQVHGFGASQTTSEQQSDHCSISSPAKCALRNGIQ